MPDLVIEKDVGAKTLEESPLFFSSKEQCLIDAYTPAPECLDDTLVRWRPPHDFDGATSMLTTIAIILILLWLFGMVSAYTMGGLIHVLLVIAIIMVLVRVIQGRRPIP